MMRKSAKGRRNHQRRVRERKRLQALKPKPALAPLMRRYVWDDVFTVPLPTFTVPARLVTKEGHA